MCIIANTRVIFQALLATASAISELVSIRSHEHTGRFNVEHQSRQSIELRTFDSKGDFLVQIDPNHKALDYYGKEFHFTIGPSVL